MNLFRLGKRIFLFVTVNILIMATISIVVNLLGIQPHLDSRGINYQYLMIFCLIWGFGGAFISLALSRIMAKWMMGVKVIDPQRAQGVERELVDLVHEMAQKAGIQKMPEVGIYDSPEVNAFATGPTKNRALVAVSAGLLQRFDRNQVAGVLGHEVAHISNGDMVTMTLIQGLVNAFVLFISRILAHIISGFVKEDGPRMMVQMLVTIVLDIVLSFLGYIVLAYFSRQREFRADEGGAFLAGHHRMVAALQGLQGVYSLNRQVQAHEPSTGNEAVATLKISGVKSGGLMALMSTHPPLEVRIEALQKMMTS